MLDEVSDIWGFHGPGLKTALGQDVLLGSFIYMFRNHFPSCESFSCYVANMSPQRTQVFVVTEVGPHVLTQITSKVQSLLTFSAAFLCFFSRNILTVNQS